MAKWRDGEVGSLSRHHISPKRAMCLRAARDTVILTVALEED